jgi:hypothetical protein
MRLCNQPKYIINDYSMIFPASYDHFSVRDAK